MPSTPVSRLPALCAGLLFLAALAPAHAQYSWIDASGTRVFSDRPPPPGIPAARILKAPRPVAAAPYGAPAPAEAPAASAAQAASTPARPTLAEREADYKKRGEKRAEDDAKAAEAARKQAAQQSRCRSLMRQEATLTAGTRLSEFDEKGERHYLTDAERAQRLAQARALQAAECR
jgi:hypothetical protein